MSNRKKNKQYNLACRSKQMYIDLLTELSISSFKWSGLEGFADYRTLEFNCFEGGSALFFIDEVMGMVVLPWVMQGNFDVNGNAIERRAYSAYNSYTNVRDSYNSVIIWNNMLRTNSINVSRIYAERLWKMDRIVDININAQKTPLIILANENQRLTMKNQLNDFDEDALYIFGTSSINRDNIKALNTEAPFVADKVYDIRSKVWNEALTYLGIANIQQSKKERLITDEVNRQMGGVMACRNSRLRARQKACEEINAMFNLNVSVEFDETSVNSILNREDVNKVVNGIE